MKTKLLFALILIITASFSKASAYTIASHTQFDSCMKQSSATLTVSFYVTVSSTTATGLSIKLYYGDGTNNIAGVSGGSVWDNHTYTAPGIYTVKQVLYNGTAAEDSVTFTVNARCNLITLRAFKDNNSDCIYNTGDNILFNPYSVEIDSNGKIVDTLFVSLAGVSNYTPKGNGTYKFRAINFPPGISVSCPSTGVITVVVTSSTSYTNVEFAFVCNSNSSLDIEEHSMVRVGRHTNLTDISVSSNSCSTTTAAVLTMTFSPKFNFQSATPTPTSVSGNVITWNLSNLSLINPYFVQVHLETPITAWLTPGDTVQTHIMLTPLIGDVNNSNNSENRADTARSSWDPNDKQVSPQGNIAAGTRLQYSIEFENDGNDTAHNIYIMDTLSSNIDFSSFRFISTTHPVTITKMTNGSDNILKFEFPGINLPDSTHHDVCRGFVVFSVKTKSNLGSGVKINNKAGIYFDENEVVMTPMVQNTIANVNVPKIDNDKQVLIYPNPAYGTITVRINNGSFNTAQISNYMGQVLSEHRLNKETNIDVHTLPAGIYYMILKGDGATKVEKFEKL